MLERVSSLKKKAANGKYLQPNPYKFDISEKMEELRNDAFYDKFPDDQLIEYAINFGIIESDEYTKAIVENLRKNKKFAKFTEDELYEYARGLHGKRISDMYNAQMNTYKDRNKPSDPIWGQYSYEEILQMEEGGVEIPQEFLEWAHGMQDSNSSDYDIESDSENDENVVNNMDNSTNTESKPAVQKRAQAFVTKAEEQKTLIENKMEEIEPAAQNITDKQEEIETEQNKAIQQTEKIVEEWKVLDEKAKNGTISENELFRYKELSLTLNNKNDNFNYELDNLKNDVNEFMSQMDDITMLIDINEKINLELEDISVRLSESEGSKRRGYLGNKKDSGKVGMVDTLSVEALGGSVGNNTADAGVELNINNIDIENNLKINISLGEKVSKSIDDAEELTDYSGNIDTLSAQETKSDEDTEEAENAAQVPDEQTPAVENSIENTETEAVPEEDGAPEGEDVTFESETAEENPEQTLAENYINVSGEKKSQIETVHNDVISLSSQVNNLNSGSSVWEHMKTQSELRYRMKEYEKLAFKARLGTELSESDIAKIKELETYLDNNNGEYVSEIQEKIDVYDSYTSNVDKLKEQSTEGKTYGNEVVNYGKEYAANNSGEGSKINGLKAAAFLSKSKRYDRLYGKSGESLGRDVIDSGEALIGASQDGLKRTKKLTTKINTLSAKNKSGQLSERINKEAARYIPLKADIDKALSEQLSAEEYEEYKRSSETNNVSEETAANSEPTTAEETAASKEPVADEKQPATEETAASKEPVADEKQPAAEETAANKEPVADEKQPAADETAASAETPANDETVSGEENQTGNDAAAEEPSEEEDPMKVLTTQYLEGTKEKRSELAIASNEVASLRNQVQDMKSGSFFNEIREKAKLKIRVKEYEQLADKAKRGQDLTENEIRRIEELEKYLDTNDGTYAGEIQGKINVLNAYTDGVDKLEQLSDDDKTYGKEAVEQGKAYALKDMGETSEKERLKASVFLSKSRKYDKLYGKSGESLGRDTIDGGENLINDASQTTKFSNRMVMKLTANYAENYSAELKKQLEEESAAVTPLKQDIDDALERQVQEGSEDDEIEVEVPEDADKSEIEDMISKGGFNASASGLTLFRQNFTSDNERSETGRTRRLQAFESKNRRAALADRVEYSKRVVMKRGKKKNS